MEIVSPPYPGEGTSADGLFNQLRELRRWVLLYRDDMNEVLGGEAIPLPREIPDKMAYTTQPVLEQFQHLLYLRRLREHWDHLIRTYEDSWDCKACLHQRLLLLQSATVQLNEAFTPFEVREAREQENLARMQKIFEQLHGFVSRLLEPRHHDPNLEEEEEGT